MNQQELNNILIDAIGDQYIDKSLFDNHYKKAFNVVNQDLPDEALITAILTIMQGLLNEYQATPAKTKGGKIGRFLSNLISPLLPLFKNIKFK